MKKLSMFLMLVAGMFTFTVTGCGSGETQVVEAPPAEEDDGSAMEGISDEEYDKEMEKSMSQ